MPDYLEEREGETGERYAGIATDGGTGLSTSFETEN
jgi:hypothetical protein